MNNLNLHKEYMDKIEDITKSYAFMKKIIRENNVQKNIVNNKNIYVSLMNLKKSVENLMFTYQRDKK
nr:hypothetical protein GTC16762_33130 [Pigmentibacter ruber]